ncbi:hypothetical protein SBA5_490002 [Candidatus Sulfotelmatomonas gaucii]|uniref:Uncharacterized protein n=1 Tax=Candidatus Sulfuritelmatomonas gaucii TaxID=2043161 RepID=A0A2N9LPV1_9BACT|nr:hypothetical protein SBA5_490002 [Candidatus Sulfotelmatomonas gaucii]
MDEFGKNGPNDVQTETPVEARSEDLVLNCATAAGFIEFLEI